MRSTNNAPTVANGWMSRWAVKGAMSVLFLNLWPVSGEKSCQMRQGGVCVPVDIVMRRCW
jgi:hypothetical protein